jgi:methanogenic corrinoid protein MtbC1
VSRLGYLVAAIESQRPSLFIDQAAWARVAHEARGGGSADDLRTCLECLREVIAEELPAPAKTVAAEYVSAAIVALTAPVRPNPTALSVDTPHGKVAAAYLMAILEGDRRRALQTLTGAARGPQAIPARDIYTRVLHPVQVELGRMWHLGETSIAIEHFSTATTQMAMTLLLDMLEHKPRNGKVVIAASVEGNAHDLGVRMVSDFLEAEGWKAVYLVPSVPPEDLAIGALDFQADLLALSATIPTQLAAIGSSIAAVRAQRDARAKILVGGTAFASYSDPSHDPAKQAFELGADGYAASPDDAVRVAARLCNL